MLLGPANERQWKGDTRRDDRAQSYWKRKEENDWSKQKRRNGSDEGDQEMNSK